MNDLFTKLDLDGYLNEFYALLARQKSVFLEGDSKLHFTRIMELSKLDFTPPSECLPLNTALMHLSKQGILHLSESFEFIKIIRYFLYLKKLDFQASLSVWLEKIIIPHNLLNIEPYFDTKGELNESLDERLVNLAHAFRLKNEDIKTEFRKIIYTKAINPYLIDTQIHLINGFEALLVRGGFNNVIKAKILGRSSGGGFYILPQSVEKLQDELLKLKEEKERIYYEYAQKISLVFHKELPFLKFIDKAFDLFDHYSARVMLAKKKDYDFVLASSGSEIVLKDFAHPALKKAKSVSLEFKKQVLLITGVNAGGKSMLLKGILSASLLAKHLLPMHIKADESKIGTFKECKVILEDPQNVKNDISTFAGRMLAFSKLFKEKDLLLGIDEIELGTDFEEAASLYSVLILKLIEQGAKIIITTHHKRLAMLLAKNESVELLAALYDEEASRPKYEFLKGTIGKSYAFETALRYGISANLIEKAKQEYGKDKEGLEELVGKNINLELELKQKLNNLNQKEQKIEQILQNLKEQKEKNDSELKNTITKLELDYHKAIEEAKRGIHFKDIKDKQRSLNKAHELKKTIILPSLKQNEELRIGDFVKYEKIKGKILSIHKNEAIVESEGLKLRVGLNLLKKSTPSLSKKQSSFHIQKPSNLNVKLDLHGLRSDEAITRLDKFISDALIAGFDEVLVYHGIGTGKLAFAVKEFLKSHKSIKEFKDAPLNQGGFGAKIIKF